MTEWQQRVVKEAEELWTKIAALELFINDETRTKNLDTLGLEVLRKQLKVMYEYNFILNLRISKFLPEYHEKSSCD